MFGRKRVVVDEPEEEEITPEESTLEESTLEESLPEVGDSFKFLENWFWEETFWAMNYTHELERRLYDLKKRCKECPYRNKEGSGCHNQIPD